MTKPSYLTGTFLPLQRGFFLSADPPAQVTDPAERPWLELAKALIRAKAGDFSSMDAIGGLLSNTTSYELWNAVAVLLGYAAPASLLRQISTTVKLETGNLSPDLESVVVKMLGRGMQLWAVPRLLNAYRVHCQAGRDQQAERITYVLSDLLEANLGPIFLREEPLDEYCNRVMRAYTGLVRQVGSDRRPVWHGQLFGVAAMARDLYGRLRDPSTDVEDIDDRLWFEAATGIDCSSFFDDGEFQPLAATAIVEEFLESGDPERFEPGVRYFFRNRIPD
jgi:hypothetical protein